MGNSYLYQRRLGLVEMTLRQSGSTYLGTALFTGLNIIDAWLTRIVLSLGGEELIYYHFFKTDILLKGLLGLLIAAVLIYLGRAKLLKWLNCGMVGVALINIACIAVALGAYYLNPPAINVGSTDLFWQSLLGIR